MTAALAGPLGMVAASFVLVVVGVVDTHRDRERGAFLAAAVLGTAGATLALALS